MRSDSLTVDIIRLSLRPDFSVAIEVSLWIIIAILVIASFVIFRWLRRFPRHFNLVKLEIELGGIGKAEFQPNLRDIQIAHTIWTELITRKAAIPIDTENDVIVEIYNSWYALFGRIRQLVSEIPARIVRQERSTQDLVRIATETLNKGLRPHLTRWQAVFRNWYSQQTHRFKSESPQEVQRSFPEYDKLLQDMLRVNKQLIQYAAELQKISRGISIS